MDRLMALLGLRLKLELRGYLRARESLFGVIVAIPGLLFMSAFSAVLLWFALRYFEGQDAQLAGVSLLATGVGLMWCLSPLTSGVAFTESHDLHRLLHFPVSAPTLVASSLLANLTQPLVWAQFPAALVLVVSLAHSPLGIVPAAIGVAESFAFILAASHLAGLVLHAVSRHRRWHDLALGLGLLMAFCLSSIPMLLLLGGGRYLAPLLRALLGSGLAAASPFGWGVRAAALGGQGNVGGFLLYAALGFLALGAVIATTSGLVGVVYRSELVLGGATSGSTRRSRALLPGTIGALVEKDLRLAWREPALKTAMVLGLVGPFVFLLLLTQAGRMGATETSLFMLAIFIGLGPIGGNAFGLERRGVMLLMAFPTPRWRVLLAKNLTAMALRLPGMVVLVVAGLVMAPALYFPAAATIAAVTYLMSLGMDNFVSVLFPISLPAPGRNPYARASGGRGLGVAVLTLMLLGVALALASPFIFLAWLPHLLEQPWLWLFSLPLALAGASAVYAILLGGAARTMLRREPDLLERILGET